MFHLTDSFLECLVSDYNLFTVQLEGCSPFVILERNPQVHIPAGTWSTMELGLVGRDNLEKGVRQMVKNKVDEFINDYLSVNPLQPSTPQKK